MKMRVAIVCPYPIDAPGGVQRHILDFSNRLKKRGHYVKIVSPSKTYESKDHIRVGTSYKMQGEFWANGSTTYIPRTHFFKFKSKLEETFDIIHIHEPLLFPPFFYGYRILKNNKARYIAHIHAMHPVLSEQEFLLNNPMIKGVMNDFDAIFASSKYSAQPYEVFGKEIDIIPNGVEVNKLNPTVSKVKKYMDGKKNLLFVGRFDERKGLRYLLEAWPIITGEFKDNVRLIIVGKGTEEENIEIKEIVDNLPNKENIVFEGFVSEERKASLYATADLFCSPATGRESFGMVLNEAMAAGTPVVAFDNPGYRTVLEDKDDICMARLYDIMDLSRKIIRILKDEKLQKELKIWGLNEVKKKYDWGVVSDQILVLYKQILKKPQTSKNKNKIFNSNPFKISGVDIKTTLNKILAG